MISRALLKQSFKANCRIWIIVTIILCLLVAQFCAMEKGVMNLTTVVYYGMMTIIIPSLYVVIVSNNLLAKQVDDGSLSYVLSSPTKRKTIALTQAIFLYGTVLITFSMVFLTHIAIRLMTNSNTLSVSKILFLNLSSFGVVVAISGICFMLSGIFNRSKNSLGISGIITVFFILMAMMAMFGNLSPSMASLANFKYLTIASLCDNNSILQGTSEWIIKLSATIILSITTYSIGSIYFCQKDLPL